MYRFCTAFDPIFFYKSLKVSRGGYESFNFLDFFQIDNVPARGVYNKNNNNDILKNHDWKEIAEVYNNLYQGTIT